MNLPKEVLAKIVEQEREVLADAKAMFDNPEIQGFLAGWGVTPDEIQKLHDRDVAALDAMERNIK